LGKIQVTFDHSAQCLRLLLQHPWLTMEPAACKATNPAGASALGAHMVRRLRGFAKLSHMKRLALVVMAQSVTDKDVSKLRVRLNGWCAWFVSVHFRFGVEGVLGQGSGGAVTSLTRMCRSSG
jgi:hypothetical protein